MMGAFHPEPKFELGHHPIAYSPPLKRLLKASTGRFSPIDIARMRYRWA